MCKILGIGSSGYFKRKKKAISYRMHRKNEIKQQITDIYFASKQRYGSPRITIELNVLGYKVSRISVAKYIKELGVRSKFSNTIEFYGVRRSMSRKGNCWDNAVTDNFFKSLKMELIYGNKLISKEGMELEIFEYIEIWYNKKKDILP